MKKTTHTNKKLCFTASAHNGRTGKTEHAWRNAPGWVCPSQLYREIDQAFHLWLFRRGLNGKITA